MNVPTGHRISDHLHQEIANRRFEDKRWEINPRCLAPDCGRYVHRASDHWCAQHLLALRIRRGEA